MDQNLISMILANRAFNRRDYNSGLKYYQNMNLNNLVASRNKYEYLQKTYFLNQQKDLCANLAVAGKYKEAVDLAEKFEKEVERAFAYVFMAEKLFKKQTDPHTFVYLDSVFSKSRSIDFSQFNFDQRLDYRPKWIYLLSRIGGKRLNLLSDKIFAEIYQGNKMNAVFNSVFGVAEEGNFYRAKSAIPSTLTETDDLMSRELIVWQSCIKKETPYGQLRWVPMDKFISDDNYYIFYVSN